MNTLLSLIKSKLRSKKITQTYNGVLVFGAVIGAAIPACPAYSGESTGALPRLCNGDCTGIIQSVSGISGITSDATNMNIYQDQGTANLNWKTFDIGVGNTVQFHQPSAEAIAINKIFDNDPSKIYGNLIANGNVYLINTNGMLFGENSRVNVRSLITSTLDIQRDENGDPIAIGLAYKDGKAAFEHDGNTPMGMIRLEDGAILTTEGVDKDGKPFEAGGRIMIFAPQIENSGEINTPEGQTVLAASQDKVYLNAIDGDKDIRGFYVEVATGGDVKNLGKIIAEKGGNITLLGIAVNQNGLVQSTTTVSENGSIKIVAKDSINDSSAYISNDGYWKDGSLGGETGKVVFGKDSITQVVTDSSDTAKVTDDLVQLESWVEAVAKEISVEEDAQIRATGGKINLLATDKPANDTINTKTGNRIYLAHGSVLDVSGSTQAKEDMGRNVVAVELRSNELKDSPIQRDGALRGETVYVDIREGTDLADISGAVGGIERGIDERLAGGGEINLSSDGDVLVEQGATIDISGGQIEYQDGYISTTQLIKDSELVDIGDADKNVSYDGLAGTYTKVDEKWGVTETWRVNGADTKARFEAGYIEGKDAGSLNIASNGLVMEGDIDANVTNGIYQRVLGADNRTPVPKGGAIHIDTKNGIAGTVQNVSFSELINPVLQSYATTPPPEEFYKDLSISTQMLQASGASELTLKTYGNISIDRGEEVCLAAGSKLDLLGGKVDVDGSIKIVGGDVNLAAEYTIGKSSTTPDVTIGYNALIDLRGNWVNDTPEFNSDPQNNSQVSIDGGSVSINTRGDKEILGGDVFINEGAVIDVSSGGWLKHDGIIEAGDGGSIELAGKVVELDGSFLLSGLDSSGSFALEALSIKISDEQHDAQNITVLGTDFFDKVGALSYSFISSGGDLIVDPGTEINLMVNNLQLGADYALQRTSDNIGEFSAVKLLPEWKRRSVDISLAVNTNMLKADNDGVEGLHALKLLENSIIRTEAGGNIKLSSNQNLVVDGLLEARGGDISLTLFDKRDSTYEELGYIPNQGIWLGDNARIDTSAVTIETPNDYGLKTGKIFDAGNITIDAQQGYIIAQQGSKFDVSGTSSILDINGVRVDGSIGLVDEQIAADAGSLTIKTTEGMFFNGSIQAEAAEVDGARGGSFVLVNNAAAKKDKIKDSDGIFENKYLKNPGVIHLHDRDFIAVYPTGSAINDDMNGVAHINSSVIKDAGFDSIEMISTNIINTEGVASKHFSQIGKIIIDDGVDLDLRNSLQLNASELVINGDVNLSGAYIAIGRQLTSDIMGFNYQNNTGDIFSGNGNLTVSAQHIDLFGSVNINGVENINLNSSGDIRLNGYARVIGDFERFQGELATTANMNLEARQIYATTLTDYSLSIADNLTGKVAISRPYNVTMDDNGTDSMSVGGKITLTAPQISHGGVLKAPGGEILLQSGYIDSTSDELVVLSGSIDEMNSKIELLDGSLTSVALENKYNLFGYVSDGQEWKYQNPYSPNDEQDYLINQLPGKKISIDAVDIDLADGAVVDVSSSGDLYSYEFVPGIGGSQDVLTNDNSSGSFAIIPTANNPYGFNDPGVYEGFAYEPGSQVYLSGMSGLAAGNYTILPARYALLPGAYLITPAGDANGILPGQPQYRIDNAQIIAGKYTTAGTGITDSLWSGFVVEPGSIARTRSEYFNYLATPFFTAKALAMAETVGRMPIDAGHLALSAVDSLIINNTLYANPEDGGKGAWIDIDTPNIKVYSDESSLPPGVAAGNLVTQGQAADAEIYISAQGLNNLGADSILLGGTRNTAVNGTQLDVGAATVEVMSGAELNGNEILLAAQDKVTVAQNAAVIASGEKNVRNETINIVGDGALLRVSAADQVDLVRSGETANKGELLIEEGAMVSASGSMLLQGTKDTILNGSIQVGTEQQAGSLYLGASQISLSNDDNIDSSGLILPTSMLEQFNLDELVISSYGALNIYNGVDLQLNNLKIEAAAINGIENEGSIANITVAKTLTLSNPHSSDVNFAGEVVNNNGTLNLNANQIVFGSEAIDTNEEYISQSLVLNGFSHINMTATNGAIGKGNTQLNFANADAESEAAVVNMNTPVLTVASGSELELNAANAKLALNSLKSDSTIPAAIGGKLSLSADGVDIASRINISGGLVNINATHDIDINGSIDVSGQEKLFFDKTEYIPAGMVSLSSESGDVNINPITADEGDIARIDISSSSNTGGKAGILAISAANGAVNLGGNIAAAGIENGGSFLLDVKEHNNFDTLFATLNQSGFDNQIAVRLRNGDMNIGAVSTTVNGRDITLAADSGSISLDKVTIDASGNVSTGGKGGEVAIWAGQDLNIGANTITTTAATTANKDGGDILLASQSGTVAIDNAARFNLAAAGNGRGGDLQIRAERSADDVKVALFDAENVVVGADAIRIEAFSKYEVDSKLDAGDIAGIKGDTATFMTNCNNNGLCEQWSKKGVTIMPGVDVIAGGDLTLTADWDLADWRYADANGENTIPGQLTIRTPGSIYLNKDLTDGVKVLTERVGRMILEKDVALKGEAWAYRINAGADLASANQLQTDRDPMNTGDLIVAAETKLRTGSGDLDIAISGDLELAEQTSVIYTFGQAQSRGDLDQLELTHSDVNNYFSGQYLDNGGDLDISVDGNILGVLSNQLQTSWQHRISTNGQQALFSGVIPTTWGISLGDFEQGIASFGGGDININTGGDIYDLNISIASTRRFDGELEYLSGGRNGGFRYSGDIYTVFSDGDLNLTSGGNIFGGVFSNDYGNSTIKSLSNIGSGANNLSPIVMMMDSEVEMYSYGNTSLQTVMNPSWVYYSKTQPMMMTKGRWFSYFYGYGSGSSLNLQSFNGDIDILNNSSTIDEAYGFNDEQSRLFDNNFGSLSLGKAWNLYPTVTSISSIKGSITLHGDLIINPMPSSTLEILAEKDFITPSGKKIILPDIDNSLIASADNPVMFFEDSQTIGMDDYLLFPNKNNKSETFSNSPTHIDDLEPVRIISANGSIGSLDQARVLQVFSAKPAVIYANEDIFSSNFYIQNLRDQDTSLIMAGGDISFFELEIDGSVSTGSENGIKISGPGRVEVIAGGDIDLASSRGIYTIGDEENSALSDIGADITVMAGVGNSINRANYSGFFDRYLNQEANAELQLQIIDLMAGYSGDAGITYEESIELLNILPEEISELLIDSGIGNSLPLGINSKNLLSYMDSLQQYKGLLNDYLIAQGFHVKDDFLSMTQTFKQLPVYKQRELVTKIIFNELKEAGKDGAIKGSNAYDRGYAAIYELYRDYAIGGYDVNSQDNLRYFLSQGTSFDGELSMYRSTVQTKDGGDINILVPGGRVFGGLAAAENDDSGKAAATAGKVGVVARGVGDVNAFTRNDFLVNQSRVFAMDGGDILMWSSETNLDAGRGAKTARGVSAAEYSWDDWGNAIVLPPTSLSGSGIRNTAISSGVEPGNVYLFAPIGVVDAGDAGIGTSGNLFVGAVEVKGADNFDIGGVAVGVQVSTSGDVSGMTSAGDVTSGATSSALDRVESIAEDKSVADEQLSWLEVFVEGLGGVDLEVEAEETEDKKKTKKKQKNKKKGNNLVSATSREANVAEAM